MAFQCAEDDAVIGEDIGRSRLFPQRRGNQAQRFRGAALLVAEHAGEMQRIKMLGIFGEDDVVEPLSLAEPALLMQRQRLLDRRHSRQAVRA